MGEHSYERMQKQTDKKSSTMASVLIKHSTNRGVKWVGVAVTTYRCDEGISLMKVEETILYNTNRQNGKYQKYEEEFVDYVIEPVLTGGLNSNSKFLHISLFTRAFVHRIFGVNLSLIEVHFRHEDDLL